MKALKSELAKRMLEQNPKVRIKFGSVVYVDGIRYVLRLVPSAK